MSLAEIWKRQGKSNVKLLKVKSEDLQKWSLNKVSDSE